MPIRHCQKCGLKVLVDESQMGSSPFYCQRCAATSKGEPGGPAAEAAPPPPSSGSNPAAAAPMALVASKGSALKIACPYCKASFTGRVPAKPAKGACPVCQKELILLPDGKVKPSAGFDIAKWKQ